MLYFLKVQYWFIICLNLILVTMLLRIITIFRISFYFIVYNKTYIQPVSHESVKTKCYNTTKKHYFHVRWSNLLYINVMKKHKNLYLCLPIKLLQIWNTCEFDKLFEIFFLKLQNLFVVN